MFFSLAFRLELQFYQWGELVQNEPLPDSNPLLKAKGEIWPPVRSDTLLRNWLICVGCTCSTVGTSLSLRKVGFFPVSLISILIGTDYFCMVYCSWVEIYSISMFKTRSPSFEQRFFHMWKLLVFIIHLRLRAVRWEPYCSKHWINKTNLQTNLSNECINRNQRQQSREYMGTSNVRIYAQMTYVKGTYIHIFRMKMFCGVCIAGPCGTELAGFMLHHFFFFFRIFIVFLMAHLFQVQGLV